MMSLRRSGEWRNHAIPIHPVLLTIFFVLHLAAANGGELILLSDLIRPIAVSLLVCLAGWTLATFLSGSVLGGALVVSVGMIGFLNFARLSAVLPDPLAGPRGTLWVIAYSLCASIVAVRCWGGSFQGTTRYFNLLAFLLAMYSGVQVIRDVSLSREREGALAPINGGRISAGRQERDIYLILLDKYTGSRLLASHYDFDNSAFENALRRRGFVVPSMARANYIHTSLALASMLNLQYLDDLSARFGEDNDRWPLIYPMVESNRLAIFLKSMGYKYVFFPSAFPRLAKVLLQMRNYHRRLKLDRNLRPCGWRLLRFPTCMRRAVACSGVQFMHSHTLRSLPGFWTGSSTSLPTSPGQATRSSYSRTSRCPMSLSSTIVIVSIGFPIGPSTTRAIRWRSRVPMLSRLSA